MALLWIITALVLLASWVADRQKTQAGVIKGLKMLWRITPVLFGVLALVSLTLAAVTPEMLQRLLGGSGPLPVMAALAIGSITLIPGFIAYPLAGVLQKNGASTAVLAAFITSLMMVGILTLPVEARFFGWRVALMRNGLAFLGTLVIAAGMAWVLG